jgi:hypothetical protein
MKGESGNILKEPFLKEIKAYIEKFGKNKNNFLVLSFGYSKLRVSFKQNINKNLFTNIYILFLFLTETLTFFIISFLDLIETINCPTSYNYLFYMKGLIWVCILCSFLSLLFFIYFIFILRYKQWFEEYLSGFVYSSKENEYK